MVISFVAKALLAGSFERPSGSGREKSLSALESSALSQVFSKLLSQNKVEEKLSLFLFLSTQVINLLLQQFLSNFKFTIYS